DSPDDPRHDPLREAPDDLVRARSRDTLGRRRPGGRRGRRGGPDLQARHAGGNDRVKTREKAFLAALKLPTQRRYEVEESLDELTRLAESAGADVVGRVTQGRRAPTPALYFGKGKAEESKTLSQRERADPRVAHDP